MTFPRLRGQRCEFEAHGKRFVCKRLSRDCWALWQDKPETTRVRFGNRQEIGEDIAAVKETGVLPRSKKNGWA